MLQVVQCLEKPMDPQSLLMVVTDSGKNLKLNQQIVNEQMNKLHNLVHKATVRRPAQPKSRAKRPAPAHAQPPKKPRASPVDHAANSAPAEPVKLSSKALGTEKECQEMRLRLQTAESRLLHSARVNAMLSQVSRLVCLLASASAR